MGPFRSRLGVALITALTLVGLAAHPGLAEPDNYDGWVQGMPEGFRRALQVLPKEQQDLFLKALWNEVHEDVKVAQERARSAGIKSNAHTLQVMIESYGVDFNGKYPKDLATLEREAQTGAYWKKLVNPINEKAAALSDFNHPVPGAVSYQCLPGEEKYLIRCWDEKGELVQDRGAVFTLSND